MSIHALNWAFAQAIRPASVKFVLVAMSDLADNQVGRCFPSVAYLAETTCQDRKTVLAAISQLEEEGYLRDSGDRVGRTKQIKVYQITMPVLDDVTGEAKSAENGTVERVPVLDGKSPVIPRKESQKRDTDSSGNRQEPSEVRKLTGRDEWQRRVDGFDPNNRRGTWKPFWGPSPEQLGDGHGIPPDILKAWRLRQAQAA